MKKIVTCLFSSIALSALVTAGDQSKMVLPPPPILEPAQYFIGGTAGHLDGNDTEFYSFHIGRELDGQMLGWDQSVFLEVAFASLEGKDERVPTIGGGGIDDGAGGVVVGGGGDDPDDGAGGVGGVVVGLGTPTTLYSWSFDLIPVTLNYKLEKAFNPTWKMYAGVGAGVAFTDSKSESFIIMPGVMEDEETVFYAQAFTGVQYQTSEKFELYGGLRYIYFDEPRNSAYEEVQLRSGDAVENSDFLVELGARFNF